MNTKIKKLIIVISITTALTFTATIPGFKSEVRAGSGGAFVGGMLAGHIVSGAVQRSKARTAAQEEMAYGQPRSSTVYVQQPATTQSAPAPAAQPTVEERLNQLDKLAANGYITPAEYKAKKQAIINGL
jgi:hypothetical protein